MEENKVTKSTKSKTKAAEKCTLSFEDALARLEEIANILENSNPPLADALTLYGESTELLKHCSELLEKANQQITVLEKDN